MPTEVEMTWDELAEENTKLKVEGMYWKHTAAKWMPEKEGRRLKLEGWGKNYKGLDELTKISPLLLEN